MTQADEDFIGVVPFSVGKRFFLKCRPCGIDGTGNYPSQPSADHALARHCATKTHMKRTGDRLRSWDGFRTEAASWANQNFPTATHASKAEHLRREATELAENPTDPEEMADVLLLLIHLADGAGVDLVAAGRAKLAKNQKRRWGKPDEHGVVEHVRAEGE